MQYIDEIARANEGFWDGVVSKGGGHTIPWLDLDVDELLRFLRGELTERIVGRREPRRMVALDPQSFAKLGRVEGKDVLCLSCGGGQQCAVFGLLGAHVTVVDLSHGQVAADREAAAHHGYEVRAIHGDMRDLSMLEPDSFDIVYAMTPCYVPDIREVYVQVSRVLKPGGLYRTDISNPAIVSGKWDRDSYRITTPYSQVKHPRDDGAMEFRHYFDDIFNGLRDSGLTLVDVEDGGRDRQVPSGAEPGTWTHEMNYVAGGFFILARKTEGREASPVIAHPRADPTE